MSTKKLKFLLLALFVMLGLARLGGKSFAASGVTVSPAYLRLVTVKSQPTQDTAISIRNDNPFPLNFKASVSDVDIYSQTLTPLDSATTAAAKAIQITNPDISLKPGQSVNILLHVSSTGLSSGGQYAAVVIKQISADTKQALPLNQAVSVGVFITREDGAERSLKLTTQLPHGIVFTMPRKNTLSFTNDGNADIVPRAAVVVYKGFDVLAKTTINANSTTLFMDKTIQYTAQLVYDKKTWPGKYGYVVSYRYDGQVNPTLAVGSFWYIPDWLMLCLIAFLVLIVFTCSRLWKQYKKPSKKTAEKAVQALAIETAKILPETAVIPLKVVAHPGLIWLPKPDERVQELAETLDLNEAPQAIAAGLAELMKVPKKPVKKTVKKTSAKKKQPTKKTSKKSSQKPEISLS